MSGYFTAGFCAIFLCSAGLSALAQTTQGTIAGRVFNRSDGSPLKEVDVIARDTNNQEAARTRTDPRGFYFIGLLSPGVYQIRAQKDTFQAQEISNLELLVASQLQFNFQLRPEKDVFGAATNHFASVGSDRIVPFFGEDTAEHHAPVEYIKSNSLTLQPVVSYVVDSAEIEALPLAGRDVYTMLALQPGLTSDAASARGLGLSVNGQRPSASNYLLDGVENNNYLVSGPLITVAPEAIQEYRISTNSFSAEYGGTTGYVANAVTRAGGNQWHAATYFYLKNDVLNANDFQRNTMGLPVTPLRQTEPGLQFGGPLIANRLYISGSGDYLRYRSFDMPQQYQLPTLQYANFVKAGSLARSLLDRFSFPDITGQVPGQPLQATATVTIAPPSAASFDQWVSLVRADALFHNSQNRLMVRPLLSAVIRPDFFWTPYKDFITPLRQTNAGIAASFTSGLGRGSSEARLSVSQDYLDFSRRWPGIPSLNSNDGTTLPGSPAFYGFQEKGKNLEVGEHFILPTGRHLLRFGGSILLRRTAGFLSAGRDSLVNFADFSSFALDQPDLIETSVSRAPAKQFQLPDFQRNYKYFQLSAFAEDSFRVNNRLVFDLGLRYENFGAPVNDGPAKDALLALGTGPDFAGRLTNAHLVFSGSGDERLYDRDNLDFSLRGGFAYALQRKGKLVLRGSYGIFYDRPFDNLWENLRNNDLTLSGFPIASNGGFNYLQPVLKSISPYYGLSYYDKFPNLVLYQPGLRTGYAENFFLGLQYRGGENFSLEINGLGSLGRRLITTDLVNRFNSLPFNLYSPYGQFNSSLPEVAYRGNQGKSDYGGVTVVTRRRQGKFQFQLSYTVSRVIDNQSDPLAGDYFNLSFASINTSPGATTGGTGFIRQFDSNGNRADADFDQRQSLVGYVIWSPSGWSRYRTLKPIVRNWTFSALGGARSGFPFSVTVPTGFSPYLNNTANLVNPTLVYIRQNSPVSGGLTLLNGAAFALPSPGTQGNSGRNAFRGPGLTNLDLNVTRSYTLNIRDRHIRITARADAFNALNHANLNNPNSLFTGQATSNFGFATFGRMGQSTGFPAVSPLNETARQIQLMLRLDF